MSKVASKIVKKVLGKKTKAVKKPAKPKSPPRDVTKSATQKDVRFKDKPEIDDAVESDAARSVDETNMTRGSASAGKSTNESGKTNIGSKSIANFIKDQMAASPGMRARSKQDEAFRRQIANADTESEKKKLRDALEKIREGRLKADEKQQKATNRKISASTRGKPKKKRTDYVTQDGEIVGKPTQEQINAAMRNAEARDDSTTATRMRKYLKELKDKEQGKGQLESAGRRMIDTDDRMIQAAKKTLILMLGQDKGTKKFNSMINDKTKSQFLVEMRSMVKGNSQAQKGTRASETGAVVGERRSSLKLADKSEKAQRGRREVGSRRAKSGNSELDAPMNRGGVVKRAVGSMDFLLGGIVVSTIDNRRNK